MGGGIVKRLRKKRNANAVKPVVPDGVRDGGGQVGDAAPTATVPKFQVGGIAMISGTVGVRRGRIVIDSRFAILPPTATVKKKRRRRPPRLKVSHRNPRTAKPLRPSKRHNKVGG